MIRSLALLFLLLPSVLLADPPRANIAGPTEAMPGDFVDLIATESVGDFFEWRVDPAQFADGRKSYRFPLTADGTPQPPQKSRTCGIASRPGTYRVTLIVSNTEGIATKEWTVVVFGSPPQQPPTSPPTTPPTTPPTNPPPVDPPPAPVGMAEWVRSNATRLVVNDPERAKTAAFLAVQYKAYSAGVGPLSEDAQKFVMGQNLLNQTLFLANGKGPAWDAFMQALAEKLAAMNGTLMQYRTEWLNIAAGLEQVR